MTPKSHRLVLFIPNKTNIKNYMFLQEGGKTYEI